jgi:tetratricopeptide (TPR) repeat protein
MSGSDLQKTALGYYQKGDFAKAAQAFGDAQAAYLSEGDKALAAEMQSNLGVVYRAQKDFAKATTTLEGAVADFRAMGDTHRLALALGNLGSVLLETNELEKAGTLLNEALSLLDPTVDKTARSEVLRILGEVRLKQGRFMDGMVNYEAGLRDVDKPSTQQSWLLKLLERPLKMLGRK